MHDDQAEQSEYVMIEIMEMSNGVRRDNLD